MQFSARFEDADNEYFYQLTHWFLHRLTCPDVLYPTVKTPGLYHFSFKCYGNSAQATYFQKWVIELCGSHKKDPDKAVFITQRGINSNQSVGDVRVRVCVWMDVGMNR